MYVIPNELVTTKLDIYVTDTNGLPAQPFSIGYGIYRKEDTLILITGSASMPPQSDMVGHYFVNWAVPQDILAGEYRIIWQIQQIEGGASDTVQQDFSVVSSTAAQSVYSVNTQGFIDKLRVILRDNNPDRNYHFRPPAYEHSRPGVTHHFGYIWTDSELYTFLEMGVAGFNLAPPQSGYTVDSLSATNPFQFGVLVIAAGMACAAVALNWVADEFDYSIGGKSLTIEKSSKYQGMAEYFNTQAERAVEQKKMVRHVAGLLQRSRGIYASGAGSRISASALRHAYSYMSPFI